MDLDQKTLTPSPVLRYGMADRSGQSGAICCKGLMTFLGCTIPMANVVLVISTKRRVLSIGVSCSLLERARGCIYRPKKHAG